jgi:hypothetical protein
MVSVEAAEVERRSPMNFDRGATALIRSQRLLDEAREELRLAAHIFGRLGDGQIGLDGDRLHRLVSSVCLLEASERALAEAWLRD